MGRERRKWTEEEDLLLRAAVNKATQQGRPLLWRELANSVPDRTNKDCRRRWCNILADGSNKGPWTQSEDERLCRAVREHGTKWSRVAVAVGSRNSDQCSSHWSLSLNPDIDYSDWTKAEDEKLLQAVRQHGTNWTTIASTCLPNRTTLALKNHYTALRTKENRAASILSQDQWSAARSWQPPNPQRQGASMRSTGSRPRAAESRERDQRGGDDDDDEEEQEEDDEDDDADEDDDDEQVNNEPIGTTAYLQSSWQGNQPAKPLMATQQGALGPVEPQSSYSLPVVQGSHGNFNNALLSGGQWGQEVQNSLGFPERLASGSFPTSLQSTSPQGNIIASGDNFDQIGNFTTAPGQYMYDHVDSGSGPQAHLSEQYPGPNLCRDMLASGIGPSTHGEPAGQPGEIDRAPLTCGPSPHQGAKQQALGSRKRRCSRHQMPLSPDSSCGRPDAHNAASPLNQSSRSLSIDTHDGDLHRVSVEAQCTNEQLGDLMRTLVGVTQKMVVKVDR